MTTFEDLRSLALQLPVKQRFQLMFDIQESLPPAPLYEEDGGLAEAERRWNEHKDNPAAWLNHDEFFAAVKAHRQK